MKKLNFQLSSIRMTYGLEVRPAEILKYTNQRKQFAIMLYHKESILL